MGLIVDKGGLGGYLILTAILLGAIIAKVIWLWLKVVEMDVTLRGDCSLILQIAIDFDVAFIGCCVSLEIFQRVSRCGRLRRRLVPKGCI